MWLQEVEVEPRVRSLPLGQRGRQDLSSGSEWGGRSVGMFTLVSNSEWQCVSAQPEETTFWYFTLGSSIE